MNFLEDMGRRITGRAEGLAHLDRHVPLLDTGIGAVWNELSKSANGDELEFQVRAVLAKKLRKWRDWDGKLTGMLDLADKSVGQPGFEIIDEVVAEIIDGSEAMQEILGYRRNLAAALEIMVKVATGQHKQGEGKPTALTRLSSLIGGDLMLRARCVDRTHHPRAAKPDAADQGRAQRTTRCLPLARAADDRHDDVRQFRSAVRRRDLACEKRDAEGIRGRKLRARRR